MSRGEHNEVGKGEQNACGVSGVRDLGWALICSRTLLGKVTCALGLHFCLCKMLELGSALQVPIFIEEIFNTGNSYPAD